MTFTKGPWLTEPDDDFEPWTTLIFTPNFDIATAWGGYNAAEADARLITAAPELFEATNRAANALGLMVEIAFRIGLEGTKEWDEIAGGADLFGALDEARAAMSRARGEV